MFVGQPTLTSENVKGWTVKVTDPAELDTTLGPFVSDTTGGTNTYFTPSKVGNYTFQGLVAQQTSIKRRHLLSRHKQMWTHS